MSLCPVTLRRHDQDVQVPHVHVEGRHDDLCHMDLFTEGIKIPEHLHHA